MAAFIRRPARGAQDETGDGTVTVTATSNDPETFASTDVVTLPTEKVVLTELGGITPMDATLAVDDATGRTTLGQRDSSEALDAPTRLVPPEENMELLRSLPTSPRPSVSATHTKRAPWDASPTAQDPTTQSAVPRASSLEDSAPRSTVGDTAPNAAVAPNKKTLGGYKVTGVLASGQMGVVYRAEHPTSRKPPVAIKAVHGQLQSNPAVIARFFSESIVLARVVHPNVVRFHDFGYDSEGSAYLVMELLEGETLTSHLAREGRLDTSTAIDIAMQIAQGLAAAHKQGVIHRDIKPDNVFLCRDGRVKLLDFGIAKIEGQGPTHTMQGDLLGTAAYMAPEQGRSASESDARSDLYSLGCVLFEMVCGVVPFPGSLVETLVAHQTAQRPPARALNREVTDALDQILDSLLARDPAARPESAMAVVTALGSLEVTAQIQVKARLRHRRSGMVDSGSRPTLHRAWIQRADRADLVRLASSPVTLRVLVVMLVIVIVLLVVTR